MLISGWGRYPVIESNLFFPKHIDECSTIIDKHEIIPRGLGRSYGDSANAEHVIQTDNFNNILEFNDVTGTIKCQSGNSLKDILRIIVLKGWFLPVTPGSSFVTIGGAIASDVHGKNQHTVGNFSEYVISIDLMIASGEILKISRTNYEDLFLATCGGMGLTGIIISATIKLKSIKSSFIEQKFIHAKNFEELDEKFEENMNSEYTVAWIDGFDRKKKFNKSILIVGDHSKSERLKYYEEKPFKLPAILVKPFMNDTFMSLFNKISYNKSFFFKKKEVYFNKFFYPLDKISSWNLFYGKKGFIQYQFVIPKYYGIDGIKKIITKITENDIFSYLTVLKIFNKKNKNFLSFPIKGYTLALDFKISKKLVNFLPKLDDLIVSMGGRIYLAKDSLMSEKTFKKSYPKWIEFQQVREKYSAKNKFNSQQSIRLGLR